jgi:dihydrofolate reductase
MRKIIFSIPISMDGFIEGPHRELDWVKTDDELHDFYTKLLQEADLLIYGRVAYELMANYWPNATSDPKATPAMKRFANTLNPMKKMVFSKTLQNAGWNTQIMHTFDPEAIRGLKVQSGNTILLSGGATMAHAFFEQGLVDEYIPVIQPAAIGSGKAIFADIASMPKLEFEWSQRLKSGAVALCYRIDRKM